MDDDKRIAQLETDVVVLRTTVDALRERLAAAERRIQVHTHPLPMHLTRYGTGPGE